MCKTRECELVFEKSKEEQLWKTEELNEPE